MTLRVTRITEEMRKLKERVNAKPEDAQAVASDAEAAKSQAAAADEAALKEQAEAEVRELKADCERQKKVRYVRERRVYCGCAYCSQEIERLQEEVKGLRATTESQHAQLVQRTYHAQAMAPSELAYGSAVDKEFTQLEAYASNLYAQQR